MHGHDIIKKSAELRGHRRFGEAIALIENNISNIDEELKINGWLEAFYAARENGDQAQAKRFASLVAAIDPDVPSIKPYL